MNCKPGDLALYVGRHQRGHGMIVHVIRPAGPSSATAPAWVVEPPIPHSNGKLCHVASDMALRPIRDPGDDAIDEMTRIAGKPTEEQDRLWAEFDTAMSELEKRLAERTA